METRGGFKPTIMQMSDKAPANQLMQKYFWGAHSGIGGGDNRQIPERYQKLSTWRPGGLEPLHDAILAIKDILKP